MTEEVTGPADLASLARYVPGLVHRHERQLSSTNDVALKWLEEGAPHGALVTADTQTAGRGRLGRNWDSGVAEDLCASIVLRPRLTPREAGALGLVVGAGIYDALVEICGPELKLKWPNDLLLGGRKVAGVLCESRMGADSGDSLAVVAGFGVNINRTAFNPELRQTATSVRLATGQAQDRARLAVALVRSVMIAVTRFEADGFVPFLPTFERHCVTLGAEVHTRLGGGVELRGRAEGLDAGGGLVIRRADGTKHIVDSGEVWLSSPGER